MCNQRLVTALIVLCSALWAQAQVPYRATSIWRPKGKTSWQWQLSGSNYTGIIMQRPAMMDVDIDDVANLFRQIEKLGRKRTDFKVICYFSMGTYENFRAEADKARGIDWTALRKQVPGMFLGTMAPPWESEVWLNIGDAQSFNATLNVMKLRTKDAYNKGCDGVEYDNIGVYQVYPKKITLADQLRFNAALLDYAHSLQLSVGLKNLAEMIPMKFPDGRNVGEAYDWFLNEECFAYDSCKEYNVLPRDRVVFGVEYCDQVKVFDSAKNMRAECFCPVAIANPRFSWLVKAVDLTAPGFSCDMYCANPANKCVPPANNNTRLCGVTKPNSLCPKYGIRTYM